MWKPTSDFMIVEQFKLNSGIYLPDNADAQAVSHTWKVLDIGPGMVAPDGKYITPEIKVGDRVAMVGKIVKVPYKDKGGNWAEVLVARAGDAIVYERSEQGIDQELTRIENMST